jgi:hypothetical protein
LKEIKEGCKKIRKGIDYSQRDRNSKKYEAVEEK